jgi:copper(I)-binding protein
MAEASSGEDMEGMDEGEGEMTMRPVDGIDIPAEGTVTLEPGGYHVMLIDLAKPLAAGETFDLTLTFENAGEQVVTVTVRDA